MEEAETLDSGNKQFIPNVSNLSGVRLQGYNGREKKSPYLSTKLTLRGGYQADNAWEPHVQEHKLKMKKNK